MARVGSLIQVVKMSVWSGLGARLEGRLRGGSAVARRNDAGLSLAVASQTQEDLNATFVSHWSDVLRFGRLRCRCVGADKGSGRHLGCTEADTDIKASSLEISGRWWGEPLLPTPYCV